MGNTARYLTSYFVKHGVPELIFMSKEIFVSLMNVRNSFIHGFSKQIVMNQIVLHDKLFLVTELIFIVSKWTEIIFDIVYCTLMYIEI